VKRNTISFATTSSSTQATNL